MSPETYGLDTGWQPVASEADLWDERHGAQRVELLREAFGWVTPMDFMVALSGNPATLPFETFAQRLINDGLPRDRVLQSLARLKAAERGVSEPRPRRDVQDPYGWYEPEPPDKVPAPAQGAQEPAQGVRAREDEGDRYAAERKATRWSEGKDLPKHRPDRRSQTDVGNHERHVRAKARKDNTTDRVADAAMGGTHPGPDGPGTCQWRVQS